jgi:hypothetical protein
MYKILTMGLTAFGLATVSMGVLAETAMFPVSEANVSAYAVTLPHQEAGWHIALETLYLVPTYPNLSYAFIEPVAVDENVASYQDGIASIKTHFDTGFGIEVGRHFAKSGRDFTIRYERFHSSNKDRIHVDDQNTQLIPFWDLYWHTNLDSYNYVEAYNKIGLDVADIMFGREILLGDRFNLHASAGLRYLHLKNKYGALFSGEVAYSNPVFIDEHLNIFFDNVYQGIGPRLVVKGDYRLCKNIHFLAQGGSSLIIGMMKMHYDQDSVVHYYNVSRVDYSISESVNEFYSSMSKQYKHVVPELDTRLGLAYTHDIEKGMYWSLEAGWKTTTYFDSQYIMYTGGLLYYSGAPVVFKTGNVNFQGPYLTLVVRT